MIAGRHSDDFEPLAWVGRVPLYATTLLVGIHVLTMIVTAVAMAMSTDPLNRLSALMPLIYSNGDIIQSFKIWQFVTYAFVNPPSIWFAVEMWLLFSFGREVEKFLGRRAFLWLYSALLLAPPAALTALGLLDVPAELYGSSALHFAIFVSFAVLYPDAEMLFSIRAKWVALVLLGIYTLSYLANQVYVPLGVMWLECACAVLMLRFSGVTNASIEHWLPPRDAGETPPAREKRRKPVAPEPDLHESIDPLLEKISRHGIGSLTRRERERLERARAELLAREKPSR